MLLIRQNNFRGEYFIDLNHQIRQPDLPDVLTIDPASSPAHKDPL
jgi:hypothetical protein